MPAVPPPRGRRFWIAVLAFVAPTAAGLLLAWGLGWLAWQGVLLVGLATLAGTGLLLAQHDRHVRGLIGFVEQFRRSIDSRLPEPPGPRGSLLTAELAATLVETTRERQRRRRELEALIAGNEAILASLPYPLLTLTEGRRVARANPAAEAIFEIGAAGRDLVAVVRDPALLAAVEAVLAGQGDRTLEFAIAGGVARHFVAHVARLPAPLLDETVAILALLDVTALKRAEQLRADFVANASIWPTILGFELISSPTWTTLTSSRRCAARRATTPRPACASSPSCRSRPSAWPGWSRTCSRCRASRCRSTCRPPRPPTCAPCWRAWSTPSTCGPTGAA